MVRSLFLVLRIIIIRMLFFFFLPLRWRNSFGQNVFYTFYRYINAILLCDLHILCTKLFVLLKLNSRITHLKKKKSFCVKNFFFSKRISFWAFNLKLSWILSFGNLFRRLLLLIKLIIFTSCFSLVSNVIMEALQW